MRWHHFAYLIGLVSMTGRIEPNRRPQSLLIHGSPGSGKTAAMERFMSDDHTTGLNPHMTFLTNATTMGLQTILKEHVPRGVSHLMVPEFQSLLLKRGGVWETMLGTLLPAMEEGVRDVYVGPKQVAYGGARVGLIAAMPTDAYFHHREMLHNVGFLSRMMVIRYERAPEFVLEARHRLNEGDRTELVKIGVDLPSSIRVHVPQAIAQWLTEYAATIDSTNIHREASRFQALAQAIAFNSGATTVRREHLAVLMELEPFWRQV